MKCLILVPPREFRDETVAMARLILGKWGIAPVMASYTKEGKECVGAHGATFRPDVNATKLSSEGYDAMFIVDGPGVDIYKLDDFHPLTQLVKDFVDNKKIVAALGNAVKVVARANVITDRRISAPKSDEISRMIRIYHGKESESEMEYDKYLLTAKSNQKLDAFLNLMLEKMGVK
ncbi:MAG: DJ-1/PfpI family protein [Candidatus Micrarchaeota archaeon]|nr:DJ-1/PfpI family protein [Candidatus Micrarchaeota archaeon]